MDGDGDLVGAQAQDWPGDTTPRVLGEGHHGQHGRRWGHGHHHDIQSEDTDSDSTVTNPSSSFAFHPINSGLGGPGGAVVAPGGPGS